MVSLLASWYDLTETDSIEAGDDKKALEILKCVRRRSLSHSCLIG